MQVFYTCHLIMVTGVASLVTFVLYVYLRLFASSIACYSFHHVQIFKYTVYSNSIHLSMDFVHFSYQNQWFFGFCEPQLTEPCIYATTRTSATKSVRYFIREAISVLLTNLVKSISHGNIWAFHFHKLFASALQTCFRVFLWKSLFCHQRWALWETRYTHMQWDIDIYLYIYLCLCIFIASFAGVFISTVHIKYINYHLPLTCLQCQLPCGDISRVHVAGQSKKDNLSSGLLGTIRWVSSREYCDV